MEIGYEVELTTRCHILPSLLACKKSWLKPARPTSSQQCRLVRFVCPVPQPPKLDPHDSVNADNRFEHGIYTSELSCLTVSDSGLNLIGNCCREYLETDGPINNLLFERKIGEGTWLFDSIKLSPARLATQRTSP